MAVADQTAWANALKQVYSPDAVEELTYADNPLHSLLKKDTNFVGDGFKEALIYSNPQGRGVSISLAQNAKNPSQIAAFYLKRVSDYATASVANETLKATKGDKGAFLSALTTEIDGSLRQLTRSLAIGEYGDGSGVIGTIGSISSATITLSNPDDVTNFEVGQLVDTFTDKTGSTQHSNGIAISSIDRTAGTITLAATTGSPAQGDVICVHGDLNGKLSGLAAWLPFTVASNDSFFGQNRSKDRERLAGCYTDGRGLSLDESIINLLAVIARAGGSPDYLFMDFLNWRNLVKILGPEVRYVDQKVTPTIGFEAVLFKGPKGVVKVVPDRNCPVDRAYALTMSTWTLRSLGMAPQLLDTDGNQMLRESTADNVEIRSGYYAQLGCSAPGYNGVVQLA